MDKRGLILEGLNKNRIDEAVNALVSVKDLEDVVKKYKGHKLLTRVVSSQWVVACNEKLDSYLDGLYKTCEALAKSKGSKIDWEGQFSFRIYNKNQSYVGLNVMEDKVSIDSKDKDEKKIAELAQGFEHVYLLSASQFGDTRG